MHTTYLLSAPVDKGGSLNVRLEQGVDRVFLWQLAVHGNHGPLQYQVGAAEMQHYLVNAGLVDVNPGLGTVQDGVRLRACMNTRFLFFQV